MYHPDLARIARLIPRQPVTARTTPVMQYLSRRLGRTAPNGVEVLMLSSGVRVRLHRPQQASRPGPALLWIHGGGYVLGNPAQDDRLCRRPREAGVPVEVQVVDRAFHGFDAIAPKTAVSQGFFESQVATLRRAFAAGPELRCPRT